MRALKFLGIFLLVAVVIIGFVIGINWDSYKMVFQNSDGLAEGTEWIEETNSLRGLVDFIEANPQHVSIASYNITQPDTGIYYQANDPRAMGSLANIFIAIEYARLVAEGEWSPQQLVKISALENFYLPNIQRTTHQDALNYLRSQAVEGSVEFRTMAQTMVKFGDLPIADFFFNRMMHRRLFAMPKQLGMNNTNPYTPYLGLYMMMNPHLFNRSVDEQMDHLGTLDFPEIWKKSRARSQVYINNKTVRDSINNMFEPDGLDILFKEERDLYRFFPKTTARDMALLMAKLQRGEVYSKAVSDTVLSLLNWPMENNQTTNQFDHYYAMYDNRMGILNGIDMGKPADADHYQAQAVFFDQLPVAFWLHMSSNHMHQDYQQRLMWDPKLYRITKRNIAHPDSVSQHDSTTTVTTP